MEFRNSESEGQKWNITIYDILGREVRHWFRNTLHQSDHIIWEGKDNAGQRLPSGVYVVELRVGNLAVRENLVLFR